MKMPRLSEGLRCASNRMFFKAKILPASGKSKRTSIGTGTTTNFSCSDVVEACRCKGVMDCFRMAKECKSKGYGSSSCTDNGCICYASPVIGDDGRILNAPLTTQVLHP